MACGPASNTTPGTNARTSRPATSKTSILTLRAAGRAKPISLVPLAGFGLGERSSNAAGSAGGGPGRGFTPPVLTSTEIVFEPPFATTRSGRPSPFKSPGATENGESPVPQSVFGPNLPAPVPSNTETVFANEFASARSAFPSPFRSAITTETGSLPVANSPRPEMVPSPSPSSVGTVLDFSFAPALSRSPSPARPPSPPAGGATPVQN